MKLHAELEQWPLVTPFRITGYTFEFLDVLLVSLEQDGLIGQGEAAGVYYKNDRPAGMIQQVEAVRKTIEAGVSRDSLQQLLPPGGARNALDCALWDLEAKLSGRPVWQIAGLDKPRPLLATFTCGADTPENMAKAAQAYTSAKAIKIKLTGEPADADRVRAIRDARADVWLGVDANQGFTRKSLEQLLPTLTQTGVQLIEQPFPIGQDALLDGFDSPIPLAADESVQSLSEMRGLVGRFDVVNIKLDKSGGLTEALAMVRAARELGLDLMVGNMMGTSLAMAPGFLLGQMCRVIDLDGPLFLQGDRESRVRYDDGYLTCPEGLWG